MGDEPSATTRRGRPAPDRRNWTSFGARTDGFDSRIARPNVHGLSAEVQEAKMAANSRIKSTGDLIRQRRWSERLRVGLLTQVLRASVRRHRSNLVRSIRCALTSGSPVTIQTGSDFRFFRTFDEIRPSALGNQRKLAGKDGDRAAHHAGSSKVRENPNPCSVPIRVS
jgi:hypothetical protein